MLAVKQNMLKILPQKTIKWVIGIKFLNSNANLDYKILKPSVFEFWADPFIIDHAGKTYLFFEAYSYIRMKGSIKYSVLDKKTLSMSRPLSLIKDKHHYSFPCVFEDNGILYLIPETAKKNRIELYELSEYPFKLTLKRVLIDQISAADSVAKLINGTWYLFTTVQMDDDLNMLKSFKVFKSNNLFSGEFLELENVQRSLTGLSNSRMGGSILELDGKCYRVAQNCFKQYGDYLNLNEVIEIKNDSYKESFEREIERPNYAYAMHTLNRSSEIEVIDLVVSISGFFVWIVFNTYRYIVIIKSLLYKWKKNEII